MAFFGLANSGGGLFGLGGQPNFRTQIIGVDASLIQASANSKIAQRTLASLSAEDRAAYNFGSTSDGVVPPWQQVEDTKTLTQQIREVRELTKFIDLKASDLKAVADDADKKASFVLFKALSNLRVLAEYASADTTSSASLKRLNEQFQKGLNEVREYLSTAQLNKLELFLGDKQYKTEASARLGKNDTTFNASTITSSAEGSALKGPDDAIASLTGTEVFTVSITKGGETDDIAVDLSEISGTLSLNNIKDHINSKIEALTAFDDEGEEYIKHQTRFDVRRDSATGAYGLQIDGTITEEVSLQAASSAPTLYVASSVSQLDDSFAVTSRITELNNLDGTITIDNTTSFAAIDYAASEVAALISDEEDDELDPEVAKLRDKFRADALAAAEKKAEQDGTATTSDSDIDTDNDSSLTNIDGDNKVNADTVAQRIATDSEGGIYVVGNSAGSFGHQLNTAEGTDVFLTKFDSEGNVVFSRLLGVSGTASVQGITVDADDNVILVGQTDSALSTKDAVDSTDLFVQKISKRGDEVFRYQLDTYAETGANSVAVDSNGDIYVGGYSKKVISVSSGITGDSDGLLLKLSGTSGTLLDSSTYGGSSDEAVKGIAVDSNDNLIVAAEEGGNAIVRRVDGGDLSNQLSSVDFGSLGSSGAIQGITIDNSNGKVYIAGTTTNGSLDAGGATVNGSAQGAQDGFVSGLTLNGSTDLSADFTTYIATSSTDRVADIVVNDGKLYVAGSTSGTLSGETARGKADAYVARLDGTSGVVEDIEQFGEGLSRSVAGGVAFTTKGDSVLETLGLPTGTIQIDQTLDIETQTSAKLGDHFYISIDGGTSRRIEQSDQGKDFLDLLTNNSSRKKITLEEGDTYKDIARKIRIAGFGKLKVEVSTTSEGEKLKISALDDGVAIELFAGKDGRDLLSRLGMDAGRILPKNDVFDIKTDKDEDIAPEDDTGGVFALGLDGAIHLGDKQTAKYVLGLLDTAVSTVQRAYRSLTYNPLIEQLKNGSANQGAASPYQVAQLANLQTGLARLQSGASSSSFSLFA